MDIILISGKAGIGKDTMANYMKDKLESMGKKVVIDRFAKYIKGYVKQVYPEWSGEKTETIRDLLQTLGTEVIKDRMNLRNFHAERLAQDCEILEALGIDFVIVPDTRFKDEVYTMKAYHKDNVLAVRIIEPDGYHGVLNESQLKHRSEIDLDDFNFDWYIINPERKLEVLHEKADKLIDAIND